MMEAKGEARELPKGWVSCELQSLCELITKGSTPTTYGHQYQEKGITFVRTENINPNGFIFNIKHFIDEEANDFLKRSRLKAGDLLFSIAGTIGRVGIVREKDFPANTNQALSILRLIKNGISVQYLFYFLKSPLIQKSTLKRIAGVGRANLSLTDVGEFNVLLAPLFEQKRIVEKIEELFSDLDQGVESLKTAQKQLKVYRQVVLEWCWVKIGDLTTGVEYGSAAKSKKEGRVPVLRMGNIQNCVFDWSDLVFSNDEQEIEKYLLKKGDVLFNRTNSPELVGKTAIYQNERPAIFAGYLIKVNQINELVLSKYLNYFLNSITAKKHGNKVKTDGVNQSNINGDKLANYPFPYSSLRGCLGSSSGQQY